MAMMNISVTEAARHFVDYVNRAHYQNVTFIILKKGRPVARLEPESKKICLGRDLAKALAKLKRK
jgi:antitoxin (DNA-binding transcriptional repressor) of toxin-antitoxin stability system